MNEQKIILLCSSRFALPVMRDLVFFKQLAVVVIPNHCDDMIEQVRLLLKDTGIPVVLVDKSSLASTLKSLIKEHGITMGLMATFSFKIPATVYTLPEKGFFNIHPGPLPAYRGADPVFWQIKNKEEFAGITIHKLDEYFDRGPVVMTEKIRLQKNDTYGLLTTKLSEVAAQLTGILLKLAGFGTTIPVKVQDGSKAVYYAKQQAKDITINWDTMDADSIIALIHACNPWNKGAVTKINNNLIRLIEAEKTSGNGVSKKPGTIITMEQTTIIVSTINDEAISINFIYSDEGFINAGRLKQLGVMKDSCFQCI